MFTIRKTFHKESKNGWVITHCNFKGGYQHSGKNPMPHLQAEDIYKTVQCNNPEDHNVN
jgi:hypothetical protein